ncbi:MAG TPA: hypothetical protein VF458_11135, partial [Ktedonobacteraceae bacterium]
MLKSLAKNLASDIDSFLYGIRKNSGVASRCLPAGATQIVANGAAEHRSRAGPVLRQGCCKIGNKMSLAGWQRAAAFIIPRMRLP